MGKILCAAHLVCLVLPSCVPLSLSVEDLGLSLNPAVLLAVTAAEWYVHTPLLKGMVCYGLFITALCTVIVTLHGEIFVS